MGASPHLTRRGHPRTHRPATSALRTPARDTQQPRNPIRANKLTSHSRLCDPLTGTDSITTAYKTPVEHQPPRVDGSSKVPVLRAGEPAERRLGDWQRTWVARSGQPSTRLLIHGPSTPPPHPQSLQGVATSGRSSDNFAGGSRRNVGRARRGESTGSRWRSCRGSLACGTSFSPEPAACGPSVR
jgi:hypothetical protein